jgi:hypothetical protein
MQVTWVAVQVCGTTARGNASSYWPDGSYLTTWYRGGWQIGDRRLPNAASFTVTVTDLYWSGFRAFIPRDTLGNMLDLVPITGPGVYTIRHPAMAVIAVEHEWEWRDYMQTTFRDAQFEPDCTKPNNQYADPIVESAEVRQGLIKALLDSGVEPFATEIAGLIYRRPDGTYYTKVIDDPDATSCRHDPPPHPAPLDGENVPVGSFHTHPHTHDEVYPKDTNCAFARNNYAMIPTQKVRASPLRNGGGSRDDWQHTFTDLPAYVITRAKNQIFRLDPSLVNGNWDSNNWHWTYNSSVPGSCAPRSSL